ncbi:MAG: leucine-rich repeat domain-containing protein, partial [Candidatus Nanosynbacter sp.]|nr:leucine-rich repeat domain-containing protein [Candidatus Nanosynbacter sp.]
NNDTTEWHTYGVKWTEGKLEYFIDGELHHTITEFKNSNSTGSPNGPFDQDFFLRLNLAIGGNYIDAPWDDPINSVGATNGEGFPATMSVDYVRVYEMRKPKEVEVKDTELRKLLNEKLGEKLGTTRAADQEITDVELEKLTDLNLDNSNITNLTGIEAAKNLKNLSLNHNSISNLSPLAGLTSLKTLSLKGNKIADISSLAGLTSLTSLNLEDQRANAKPNDKSFASPLKDLTGNVVSITNSAEVINDTATPGNIQLLSLPANGASSILNAPWTRSVTIGAVSATFSGTMAIDTSAIPRAVQPQPQPQPANPSAATHNPANKPQSAVSSLLANTGFNVFLGVIATLALVAAGLFILR